jgi:hypothetical protein
MSRSRRLDLCVSLGVGVIILGPFLFRRGYALRGDMVFVPHQPWKEAWLGLDGSTARFVPGDAVVSLLTAVVPGDLVQKALLLGTFVLAGTGTGLLVRHHGFVGRAAAIVVVCWNPWVAERLLIGQWALVVGYAALPWVVMAALKLRDDVRLGLPALVCWLGFSALWSPPAALLSSLAALCVVVVHPRAASVAAVVGTSMVVDLPWLVPSLLASDRVTATGDQFAAFVARGESAAGLLPSVLTLGGIWKTSVVPEERTLVVVVLLSAATVLAAVLGWRSERVSEAPNRAHLGSALVLLAGCCLALSLVPALPGVADALDSATRSLPALAILRDSHRFLGPAVLVLVPGVAASATWLWRQRPGRGAVRVLAVLLTVWPALCLPSMAWGLRGSVEPVVYPDEWFAVADLIEDEGAEDGATVVLPWRGGYRGYDWNERRAMLDPAPRFFDTEVLIDDRVYLGDTLLANEDPRLADVTAALEADDPSAALSALGVARVLVETDNGVAEDEVPAGTVVHDGPRLTLVDLDGTSGSATYPAPPRSAVLAADLVALLGVVVATACAIRRRVYGAHAHDSGRGSE